MPNLIFEVLGEENVNYICSEFDLDENDKRKIEEVFIAWEEDFRKKDACDSCAGIGHYDRRNKLEIMEDVLEGNPKFKEIGDAIVQMCSEYCIMKNITIGSNN